MKAWTVTFSMLSSDVPIMSMLVYAESAFEAMGKDGVRRQLSIYDLVSIVEKEK